MTQAWTSGHQTTIRGGGAEDGIWWIDGGASNRPTPSQMVGEAARSDREQSWTRVDKGRVDNTVAVLPREAEASCRQNSVGTQSERIGEGHIGAPCFC